MARRAARAILVTLLVLAGGFATTRDAGGESAAGGDTGARPETARSDLRVVAPLRGRSLDEERDPGRGPRPHEPLFLEPATVATAHARLGLSAWITPGAPAEHRENPGGLALGLTIAWPAPPREVAPAGPGPWRGSVAR